MMQSITGRTGNTVVSELAVERRTSDTKEFRGGGQFTTSLVSGVLVAGTHVTVPPSAEGLLKLLSGATSPCALVSLGLFLSEKRPSGTALGGSLLLTGSKLLLQPVVTWLAARLFALPLTLAQTAVVLTALPTGTGPFMLAEFYRREAHITSRTILLSTLGSLVSLSLLLFYMPHNG
jgi:predicted permease